MSDAPQPDRASRGPQWTNSYEAQLSDGDLRKLHEQLLSRSLPDTDIRKWLPPWKAGKRVGQKPSLATLSNIRDRLEMEEESAEDASTVESIKEELRNEVAGISQAELDSFAQRTFSLLTVRRRDLEGYVRLRSAQTKGEIEKAKLELAQRAEARMQEALTLEKERFRRDTCELFLKWHADKQAAEIAASVATNAEKIDRLGKLMFPDWEER